MSEREPWFRQYERPGANGHVAGPSTFAGIHAEDWPALLAAEKRGEFYEREEC